MKPSYQLIICDSEAEYAQKLADYLRRSRECCFTIAVYTSSEAFLERETEQEIELLLIEKSLYQELVAEGWQQSQVKKLLLLDEEKAADVCMGVQEKSIYKYQAGSGILFHLLGSSETDKTIYSRKGAQTIVTGIYSPINRTLKTSFALTLGQIYAEKEETLYLNLEGCSGLRELLSLSCEKNLSDLVYEFSVKRNQFPLLLYQFVHKIEELALIPPMEFIAELQCISCAEWIVLLEYIVENGGYKHLILDIGENVNGIMELLQMCDVIYEPIRSDCVSMAKIAAFESALQKCKESRELAEKIRKLEFPYFEDIGEGFANLKYSALGSYVRQLVDREEV